jgi:hypothetical protein
MADITISKDALGEAVRAAFNAIDPSDRQEIIDEDLTALIEILYNKSLLANPSDQKKNLEKMIQSILERS